MLKNIIAPFILSVLAFFFIYAFLLVTAPCGQYEPSTDCNITNNQ